MFDIHAIATVKCPVNQMSQGNWATVDSEIHLDPEYAAGLQGLEGFSHVLGLFFSRPRAGLRSEDAVATTSARHGGHA